MLGIRCCGLPVHHHFCCKPSAQEGAGKSGDAAGRAIVGSLTKGLQCTGLRLQILSFFFFFPLEAEGSLVNAFVNP